MNHPLEFVSRAGRKPLFFFFLAFTVVIYGVFAFLDTPLRTTAAPSGIVWYELAGTFKTPQAILNSGDETARLFVAFGLGFDFLFMPVYALALSLGLILAGFEKPKPYQTLTVLLGWGAFIAAGFDAIENYALWKILAGDLSTSLPQAAAICATIKFILLIIGLVTAVAGLFIKKTSG